MNCFLLITIKMLLKITVISNLILNKAGHLPLLGALSEAREY